MIGTIVSHYPTLEHLGNDALDTAGVDARGTQGRAHAWAPARFT